MRRRRSLISGSPSSRSISSGVRKPHFSSVVSSGAATFTPSHGLTSTRSSTFASLKIRLSSPRTCFWVFAEISSSLSTFSPDFPPFAATSFVWVASAAMKSRTCRRLTSRSGSLARSAPSTNRAQRDRSSFAVAVVSRARNRSP